MSENLVFNVEVDNSSAITQINNFFDAFQKGAKNASAFLDNELKEKQVNIVLGMQGGKPVAKQLDNMAANGTKLEKAAKVVNGEFGQTANEINQSVNVLRQLLANTQKLDAETGEVNKDFEKLVNLLKQAKNEADKVKVDEAMGKSITAANIAANLLTDALYAAGRAIADFLKEGAEMEVLMVQLEGFTGSSEAAEAAFNSFLETAAATPFNVKEVTEAARTMMGFGASTEEAKIRVEQLAMVAAATGGDLNNMSRNLGQIQANQRAYTRDLMQFANNGIPIYQMLADVMGATTAEVRKFAEDGMVGYRQVTDALDLMTEKGSAYEAIMQNMNTTFAARFEAMAGAVSSFAGKFINFIQTMDRAAGGLIGGTFDVITAGIKQLGKLLDALADNADILAPIFAGIGAAIVGMAGVAAMGAMKVLIAAFIKLKAKIMATAMAQGILAALSGQWHLIAAGALVAVAGVSLYRGIVNGATKDQSEFNKQLKEEKFDAMADSAKMFAFSLEGLNSKQKKVIESHKKRFDILQQEVKEQEAGMERAMAFLEMEAEKRKEDHQKIIDQQKEKEEIEKENHKNAMEREKERHSGVMEQLNEQMSAIHEQHKEKMGELDSESSYARELKQIRRAELQSKLRSGDLTRKETLQIREQLHQMDVREKKQKEKLRFQQEEEKLQGKINAEEKKHADNVDAIENKHKKNMEGIATVRDVNKAAIEAINAELDKQSKLIEEYKNEELRKIYENEQAAIRAIRNQITEAQRLKGVLAGIYDESKADQTKMRKPSEPTATGPGDTASRARTNRRGTAFSKREGKASGGPVTAGTAYTVNELGREAFLSASGHLSMIDAASWGKWIAPSAGTVIPANLTRQLDIPSGGINLDKAAGQSVMRRSGVVGGARVGDNVVNNVTIQSSNTRQQAMDTMVQLARLKRARYS